MRGFQKLRRADLRTTSGPMVAIHKRKLFALDQLAYEALGEPEACELYYNPDKRVIGFQAAERGAPDSYVVRHHTKFSHQVEGRAFFKRFGLSEEATGRRYRAELMDGILTVSLDQEEADDEGVDS